MSVLPIEHLHRVERWTGLLAVIVIAVGLVFLPRRIGFGVGAGAGLMVANAFAIRVIGEHAFRRLERPGLGLLLFNLKLLALAGVVFVLLHTLAVDMIGFLCGISVFPLAIVATAVQAGLLRDRPQEQA